MKPHPALNAPQPFLENELQRFAEQLGARGEFDLLGKLIAHQSPQVRLTVANTFCRRASNWHLPLAQKALDQENLPNIAAAWAEAVSRMAHRITAVTQVDDPPGDYDRLRLRLLMGEPLDARNAIGLVKVHADKSILIKHFAVQALKRLGQSAAPAIAAELDALDAKAAPEESARLWRLLVVCDKRFAVARALAEIDRSNALDGTLIPPLVEGGAQAARLILRLVAIDQTFMRSDYRYVLIRIGHDAYPEFLRAFRSDPWLRANEARLLVKLGGASAIEPLMEGLLDSSRAVRFACVAAFHEFDDWSLEQAAEPLRGAMQWSKPDVKNAIADLVALRLKSDVGLNWLLSLVLAPDLDDRALAVKRLGGFYYDDRAATAIERACYSYAEVLRLSAAEAVCRSLESMDDAVRDSRGRLLKLLRGLTRDSSPDVRERVFAGLRQSRHTTEASDLSAAFENEPFIGFLGSKDWFTPPVSDQTSFSITAPSAVQPGGEALLDVWAYPEAEREEMVKRAHQESGLERLTIQSVGTKVVTRGTALMVSLAIPSLAYQDEDWINWAGHVANCAFKVSIPKNLEPGRHAGTVRIFVEELQITRLFFDLLVGQAQGVIGELKRSEERVRNAFASYSSDDRDRVLGRIQGMKKIAPEIDVFLDVISLRSGQNWKQQIETEILHRDVLYLFWSRAAASSSWVDYEWRTALRCKGIEGIDPVPLEPPEQAPPPVELADLHFHDLILQVMSRRG